MGTLIRDVRHASRMLIKSPGFSLVAVIALTLGIGANTAIFSVVNAVLLRPLPYEESERLVFLSERSPQLEGMSVAYPNFVDWRNANEVFEDIAVFRRQSYNLIGRGEPERLVGGHVSAGLFDVLRAPPALGRGFTEDEDKQGAGPVAVLSYGLWQRRFGGDRAIIDQPITLDGRTFIVIGVMPRDFLFPSRVELWTPVGQASGDPGWQNRGNHPGLYGVARLRSGITLAQARANMDQVAESLEQQYPKSNTGNRVTVTAALEQVVTNIRPALIVLLGAVGLVLLIACANVANLLLARATSRKKEMAVRVALGAGRWRIIRQLLTESMLLSFVGGGLGLFGAYWGVKLIVAISPDSIPRAREINIDPRVLAFTVGVSLLTGILFGLVPAIQASMTELNDVLKEAGRGLVAGRHLLRSALVVVEVALTLMLLVAAGLMIRSFYHLLNVDPGFRYDNLLTFNVSLPQRKYPEDAQRINFYETLRERIAALPGIDVVALSSGLPLGNNGWQTSFWIEGRPEPPPGQIPLTEAAVASPDYFRAMGITMLKGRFFAEQDTKDAPRVAVIDEEFERRYWPDEDAVGKRFRAGGSDPKNPLITVVGVVRRVKMDGLNQDSNRVQSYYPFRQLPYGGMTMVVRTAVDPMSEVQAIREQVLSVDPDQPIYNVNTMQQLRADSIAPDRLNLMLLGALASVALALAAVGIYGVLAYSVTQRTHEIGVRMALGATPGSVLRMVVQHGMGLTGIGLMLGVGLAWISTRAMSNLLFGVSPTDPPTFIAIWVVLALVALGACLIPARRALKLDPMIALRYE